MTTGLTLAAFALESLGYTSPDGSLRPVSKHSLDYAKQIFNYILECEIPGRGGCFLRVETPYHKYHPFLASTDELLGICVGLRYYYEAVAAEPDEQARVRELVGRMAECFGAHGYWILPWANNDETSKKTIKAWLHSGCSTDDSVLTRQIGWSFGYAFFLFFIHIAGKMVPPNWDSDQKDLYCRSDDILGEIIHPDVDKILSYLDSRWVEFGPKRDTDIGKFFIDTVCPNISLFAGLKPPLDFVFTNLEENYYNFNMLALASILVMECGDTRDVTVSAIGNAMLNLLQHPSGKKNSLFATVLNACISRGAIADGKTEALEGINVLIKAPSDESAVDVFDHDLSLYNFNIAEQLSAEPADSPAAKAVSAATGMSENEWRDLLKKWDLPVRFNVPKRWGGSTIWTSKADCRIVEDVGFKAGTTNLTGTGGTGLEEIARELFSTDEPLAMALETCGAGFLFARMLATRSGALPPPNFADQRWATLPFVGATPFTERTSTLFAVTNEQDTSIPPKNWQRCCQARPEKELVGLKSRFVDESFPGNNDGTLNTGFWYKFGAEGFIRCNTENNRNSIPFYGKRIFRYGDPCRPDLLFIDYEAKGFRSIWQIYFEFAETGEMIAGDNWPKPMELADHVQRVGRFIQMPGILSCGDPNGTYTENGSKDVGSAAIRPLLQASLVQGRMCVRLIPGYPSVGNEIIEFSSWPPWCWVIRVKEVAHDSPYHYALNAHQGTIHDLRKLYNHQMGFGEHNIVVLPLFDSAPDVILNTARAYSVPLQTRMPTRAYRKPLNPSEARRLKRTVHLCPRCFFDG
jgi:hypothetical protein